MSTWGLCFYFMKTSKSDGSMERGFLVSNAGRVYQNLTSRGISYSLRKWQVLFIFLNRKEFLSTQQHREH